MLLATRPNPHGKDGAMAEPLTQKQIEQALTKLPGWTHDGNALVKQFKFGSFKEALSFIVRVGLHAEELSHHPDLHNVYDRVTLRLNTHDAGGKVTQKDIDLANAIAGFSWVR
jgi:4a-hydroxytetrahydrobiopterin dehydratase